MESGPSGVLLQVNAQLPFVPTLGMMLAVTSKGDLLAVEDVMWFVDKPDELEIWLTEPNLHGSDRPAAYWKRQGWKKAPQPKFED
jgi:hypothetical protein